MPEDTVVDTAVTWPSPQEAGLRVREMQTKVHRWAAADRGRRFDDVYNFVSDQATLVVALQRVAGNAGARTAGVELPLLDNLRLECPFPIPGNINPDFTGRVRDHRLASATVAHIGRLTARLGLVLLVTEVLGHLLIQRGLEVITHGAHPAGPQPGVSGRKRRSWHSPNPASATGSARGDWEGDA